MRLYTLREAISKKVMIVQVDGTARVKSAPPGIDVEIRDYTNEPGTSYFDTNEIEAVRDGQAPRVLIAVEAGRAQVVAQPPDLFVEIR